MRSALLIAGLFCATGAELLSSVCTNLMQSSMLSIDEGLTSTVLERGQSIELKCVATSSPQASITWYRNGHKILQSDSVNLETRINRKELAIGTIESRLLIPCLDHTNAGEYSCVAENECGHKEMSSGTVALSRTSKGPLCKRSQPVPPVISMATITRIELVGNSVQLVCRAEGNPAPAISWHKLDDNDNTEDIENDVRFMKLSSGDLLVVADENNHQLNFRCSAHNTVGEAHSDAAIIFVDEE